MGAWGKSPWDNDGAADWYGDLFEATGLAARVEEALEADPDDAHEDIRAAAYILIALGRVYIWPIGDLDRHLRLAISKLEAVRDMEIYRDANFTDVINDEIATLRARLQPSGG
jgi:hypothetical protein